MKSKEQKRTEAEQRQAAHDALTIEQKIAKAESRGGSERELRRLRGQA